ncbi:hypothetical protein VCRA2120O333_10732 [Vibrio crassostreae]|nr:hypothetical protein VCRA2111O320_120067 [Vibrio crassostreae]CAK1749980.1 hypothetical protein VCRA2113O324_130069 [Vibrio crassostreae]CAK2526279.1 hypothetical protein VCRA2114E327_70155 [Vibrio crassostreae]CAK2636839.1 hypothetical protein VCRA2121O336_140067 [Vibrio crassostreae]CAK2963026.1 hypothetical protein VCRA2113O323_60067 [Vibrio crassostreae]
MIDSLGFLFLGYGTVNCCQPLSVSEPTYWPLQYGATPLFGATVVVVFSIFNNHKSARKYLDPNNQ